MSLMNSVNDDNLFITSRGSRPPVTKLELKDIPVVFLSFDEPNADENYDYLYFSHPNKQLVHRVHGVKGFDAAHKAAAKKAGTQRFFTVDADCKVNPDIWKQVLTLDHTNQKATFSWSSRNIVNGLVYGNGGIKLWYGDYVLNMQTHEASTDNSTNVDFCWDFENYKQMNNTFGTVVNNASMFQAFRAGFREGVKMGLDEGKKVPVEKFNELIYPANYSRWLIWMTVGRDVENGIWAMYGARLGAYKLYVENFDHSLISNYDWFQNFWQEVYNETAQGQWVEDRIHALAIELNEKLKLPVVELNAEQSVWFKHVLISPAKETGWPTLYNLSASPLFGFKLRTWD
jgi:hypothetical protein